jgi:hypothetical protein
MKRLLGAVAVLAPLAACGPTYYAEPSAAPANPYASGAWALRPGRNMIIGSTAVVEADGRTRTCAGNAASLIPVTPATRARMDAIYGRDTNVVLASAGHAPPRDPRLERIVVHNMCDPNGDFRFTDVPDGNYYVTAGIPGPTMGSVKREVSVRGGQVRHVTLTN